MAKAVVIGAGVSGLVTARTLEEAGFDVQVVARDTGPGTTSWAAGAIWYPYRADPPHRVTRWAALTRTWLMGIAKTIPEAGVDILTLLEADDSAHPPSWADAAPDLRPAPDPTPCSLPHVWTCAAPRVEPSLFLGWLERSLARKIEHRQINSFDDVDDFGAYIIINCTGLGARGLASDDSLRAIFGQTVITAPGEIDLSRSFGDNRHPRDVFYAIPRRGEVVLGGVAIGVEHDHPPEPDPAIAAAILARATDYGYRPGPVLRHSAGLRPYRPGVRVELDPQRARNATPIIHNYGHGGAGFTLCRGCAEDVRDLAVNALKMEPRPV